jgi:protein KRI1
MTKSLFDDDDDNADQEEQQRQLRINKKFAKAYEERKLREEFRNTDLDDDDESSEDDESEDDEGMLPAALEVNILKTINALRNKDESIYDPNMKFFDEEAIVLSHKASSESKKPKQRIKDMIRQEILEQMENSQEPNEERRIQQRHESKLRLEYDEEQKELRSAFLETTKEDDEEDDNLLLVKTKSKYDDEHHAAKANQELDKEFQSLQKASRGDTALKDPRGEVQDGEQFLLDYLKNKKWMEKDDDDDNDDDDDEEDQDKPKKTLGEDEDSIEEVDRAEDFEARYNFRFEEAENAIRSGADLSVIGYARSGTMATLRRSDDARSQKRMERKERKSAERKAKEEQLRRLKNAKRIEMEKKLGEIRKALGSANCGDLDEDALLKLMEDDYDPEKFEKIMQETYGTDFYDKQDKEWKSDADVRESLLKDEDGNMLVGEDDADGGLYDNGDLEDDGEFNDDEDDENEEEVGDYGDDEILPPESKVEQKLRSKMQEELYKLDYEDIISGMPTRFKYRSVEPNRYGLSTREILLASDTTLKTFVSLKKMAPYREEGEHRVGYKKRKRFRDMLHDDIEKIKEDDGIRETDDSEQVEEVEESRKKRRRQKKGNTGQASNEDGANVAGQDHDTGGDDRKKRRRRKRSKRVHIAGDDEANRAETQAGHEQDGDADDSEPPKWCSPVSEKIDTPSLHASGASDKKKNRTHRKNRKGERKLKKHPNGMSTIDGMTASRLTAYGL